MAVQVTWHLTQALPINTVQRPFKVPSVVQFPYLEDGGCGQHWMIVEVSFQCEESWKKMVSSEMGDSRQLRQPHGALLATSVSLPLVLF
jgi:hypothetical protein